MEGQNSKITPEKAKEILRQAGKEVTIEEAAKILDFLKNLAKIVVKHYLNTNENS
jgi:hypothetical protein